MPREEIVRRGLARAEIPIYSVSWRRSGRTVPVGFPGRAALGLTAPPRSRSSMIGPASSRV
jgi:hypothetical protein